jgi:Xaa-Pro aminopeptidase
MEILDKLTALRKHMQEHGIDLYLVPSIDEHNSEYVPHCWQRRSFISGFDGSAGEVIVTQEHAYLWTDGRYFLQAQMQLNDEHYTLVKQTGLSANIEEWLTLNHNNIRLGVDSRVIGIERAAKLKQVLSTQGSKLVLLDTNLVDLSRQDLGEKLTLPVVYAFYLPIHYTGMTVEDKLAYLRGELTHHKADYILFNVLDEIAWLFNMRGGDIDFNPLVISYAVVGKTTATLFVDGNKLSKELADILIAAKVQVLPYQDFALSVKNIEGSVMLDDRTASCWMLSLLTNHQPVLTVRSPLSLAKAVKNKVEVSGSKAAHIYDAVAVINFLAWLDNHYVDGVDEIIAAEKLLEFRKKHATFKGESFATISGFADNGAIIHYHSSHATNKVIDNSNIYLVDSGGQYLEGTTDITRTIHLGNPTKEQKHHYTLVLKGHLALSRAKFPHGTCGEHLDALARVHLWHECLNYRHGTGHGVGSFLCVHEGPQRISPGISAIPLVPGMIVSNEPGFYLDGEYGIRIENLCLVTEIENSAVNGYGKFYGFENLTLVPYCSKLIEFEILTEAEQQQIRDYYSQIRQLVYPLLNLDVQVWLDKQLHLSSSE